MAKRSVYYVMISHILYHEGSPDEASIGNYLEYVAYSDFMGGGRRVFYKNWCPEQESEMVDALLGPNTSFPSQWYLLLKQIYHEIDDSEPAAVR